MPPSSRWNLTTKRCSIGRFCVVLFYSFLIIRSHGVCASPQHFEEMARGAQGPLCLKGRTHQREVHITREVHTRMEDSIVRLFRAVDREMTTEFLGEKAEMPDWN